METKNCETQTARVSAIHKERYALQYAEGEGFGRLKTAAYYKGEMSFPTVGDLVEARPVPGGDAQILRTLPRKSVFWRRDGWTARGQQAVAANFDLVCIVQALPEDFNPARLERYLTMARQSGAQPVVLLSKADAVPDAAPYIQIAAAAAPGVEIYAVSAKSGAGLPALQALLRPQCIAVFLGSSGVGKSSLLNALCGQPLQRTGAVRADGKGRHTTIRRQLLQLPGGARVIDTPGMRELGLCSAEEGLAESFPEIQRLLGKCRFADCRHQTEPGCAIRAALADGSLLPARWENWQRLQQESAAAARWQTVLAKDRQKKRRPGPARKKILPDAEEER